MVVDGLDEAGGYRQRAALVTQIRAFARRRPTVPILVTSRPYPELAATLPEFQYAEVAPWSRATRRRYLDRLAVATGHGERYDAAQIDELLASTDLREMMGDPLGLQMATMMEDFVRQMLVSRELGRLRLSIGSPEATRGHHPRSTKRRG